VKKAIQSNIVSDMNAKEENAETDTEMPDDNDEKSDKIMEVSFSYHI